MKAPLVPYIKCDNVLDGLTLLVGAGGSFRNNITSSAQCCGSRCVIRLGRTCVHYREGQSYEEVTERQTRLDCGILANGDGGPVPRSE